MKLKNEEYTAVSLSQSGMPNLSPGPH